VNEPIKHVDLIGVDLMTSTGKVVSFRLHFSSVSLVSVGFDVGHLDFSLVFFLLIQGFERCNFKLSFLEVLSRNNGTKCYECEEFNEKMKFTLAVVALGVVSGIVKKDDINYDTHKGDLDNQEHTQYTNAESKRTTDVSAQASSDAWRGAKPAFSFGAN